MSVRLCHSLACHGSHPQCAVILLFLCSKYGICRSDVTSGIDRMVNDSYTRSSETDDDDIAYRIQASVIRVSGCIEYIGNKLFQLSRLMTLSLSFHHRRPVQCYVHYALNRLWSRRPTDVARNYCM